MSFESQLWLERITLLIRVLGHQIKTPLTVLTNEVAFLEPTIPEGEYKVIGEKLTEISTVLKKVLPPGSKKLEIAEVRLSEVASELGIVLAENLATFEISCDRQKIVFALRELMQTLQTLASRTAQRVELWRFEKGEAEVHLTILLNGAAPNFQRRTSQSSFTEWLMITNDVQSVAPPIIDAIFIAHDWVITINHSDTCSKVMLSFPATV